MVLKSHCHAPPGNRIVNKTTIGHMSLDQLFQHDEFRDLVAHRLAEAVRIPTVAYDGMGHVGTDPRFQSLHVDIVNEHGIILTWHGSDATARPLLFMAHSDVVPAGSSSSADWTYPPFSGYYDGEFIWGRGAEDDKSNLIAMLSAIDSLLQHDFVPSRTVILSIGFDEEGGAERSYGARCLAQLLLDRYGENGIELIFDEGIAGVTQHFGTDFALPGTAEKGYIDVTVSVRVAGGHSSTPPDHTAIGYLAQVIGMIEDQSFQSRILRSNPTLRFLEQAARFSRSMPEDLRKAILDPDSTDKLQKYMDSIRDRRAMIRTTTAVDIVSGGDKVNSLPESASAVINHRIAIHDSVQTVKDHYLNLLLPWASKHGFDIDAFGSLTEAHGNLLTSVHEAKEGVLVLSAQYELEPSPVTDAEDIHFEWLENVLHSVFGHDVIVAPELLTGNTDTQYYWNLSTHIYRMSPWRASHDPRGSRMHTIDERMPVKGLLEMVKFYDEFIRVVDEKRA